MAEAKRDQNHVTTLLGVSNTDGTTIRNLTIAPTTHFLQVKDGITGSSFGGTNAIRDQNHVPVMIATSETDGTTPVPLYVDSDNFLLVDSN